MVGDPGAMDEPFSREIALRAQLTTLRAELRAAQSQIADLEVRLAQSGSEQRLIARAFVQRVQELAPLSAALAEARRANERICAELDQLKAVREQNMRLSHEAERLRAAAGLHEQHVHDLLSSRWRKLGLRMGVARRAAWENGSGQR